ncbi:MAG: sugar ABC transporter permease [Clostridia bacterium]|nr:sugar ABC transporter permease [Clostridia bacterium]
MKKNILDFVARKDDFPQLKKKKKHSTDFIAWVFMLPCIVFLYITMWRPIFMGTYLSLFKLRGYTPVEFVGFDNYIKVVTDTNFLKALTNTIKYVVLELLLGFTPPIIIALMLNEIRVGHKTLKFAIYFPTIVPGIVTAMMWRLMYEPNTNGLINNILGHLGMEAQPFLNSPKMVIFWMCISMAWSAMGGRMIYYLSGLQGINSELYEAAAIEGAGVFRRMWKITLPQVSGIIFLFFVKMIIQIFQIMEAPLTMTDGGPNNASITLGLQSYRYAFENFKVEYALAMGMIQFFMLIGITIFYFYMQKKVDTE